MYYQRAATYDDEMSGVWITQQTPGMKVVKTISSDERAIGEKRIGQI